MIITAIDHLGFLRTYSREDLATWEDALLKALDELQSMKMFFVERGHDDYFHYYQSVLQSQLNECQRLLGTYYRAA